MKYIMFAIALVATAIFDVDIAHSATSASSCPCSGSKVCVGPRGGHYCITSSGNKRYIKK
jgi:hypothetical protein